jgi:hypothetical protein
MPKFDGNELKLALISWVRAELLPSVTHDEKFLGRHRLAARFNEQAERWTAGQSFRQILETANEIAAVSAILQSTGDITELAYEPRLCRTKKTIDFRIGFRSGRRCWIDVKTVAPEWRDDDESWNRFKQLAADFPSNSRLVVARELSGAAISGQEIKARWTFITRTQEAEEKEALLSPDEKAPVQLLFCSNGPWRKDSLEDFADFYRTGCFRPDDWSRNAIARYLREREIVFARTLAGFSYLRLRWECARIDDFEIDVRGPEMGG